MAIEIATILLGAGFAGAVVLYAAPKGWLGHPRQKVNLATVTSSAFSLGSVGSSITEAVSPPTPVVEASPPPAPAPFETPHPEPTAPPPVPVSPVVTFGPSASPRVRRTYRRRTTPARSSTRVARRTRHR